MLNNITNEGSEVCDNCACENTFITVPGENLYDCAWEITFITVPWRTPL